MNETKRKRLEEMGGRVTTVAEFLDLSPEEEAHIEIKLALRRLQIEMRKRRGLSQAQLAELLGTKQPGVARMENDSQGTGFDLLLKALIELGATPGEIGKAIGNVTIHATGSPSRWKENAKLATARAVVRTVAIGKPPQARGKMALSKLEKNSMARQDQGVKKIRSKVGHPVKVAA